MNFKKLTSIILVILWMIIVFHFSNQQGETSGKTSKMVATKIVEIIDMQGKTIHQDKEIIVQRIEPIIRKLAHYSIYSIGGMTIINCIYLFINIEKRAIIYSTLAGIIYAVLDEIHQLFINGRSGAITDVIIDSLGILTGIAIYLLIQEILRRFFKSKLIQHKGGKINWI